MLTLTADVLVIGGGATGTGVAWDATLRGLDVILVERDDLAQGTSGRFHGLLHSGGRYVVNDPTAARECIEENRILRQIAADCIEDTGGLSVCTRYDDPNYAGVFADACQRAGVPYEEISVAQALREEPHLDPRSVRAFQVPDASIDGGRLVRKLAEGARRGGARILPHHALIAIRRDGDSVTGASICDRHSGQKLEIQARVTVNATGPWVGRVAELAGIESVVVLPNRGTMVAVPRLAGTVLSRCRMPNDGDLIVPVGNESVLGTTGHPTDDPGEVNVDQRDVERLLEEGEKLIPGLRRARKLRAWSAVRPLFDNAHASVSGTRETTRTHALLNHQTRDGVDGLITVTGGKLTTFRLMAQQTVDCVCSKLGVQRACTTATQPLASAPEEAGPQDHPAPNAADPRPAPAHRRGG